MSLFAVTLAEETVMILVTLDDRVQGLLSRRTEDQLSKMALDMPPHKSKMLHDTFKERQACRYNDRYD